MIEIVNILLGWFSEALSYTRCKPSLCSCNSCTFGDNGTVVFVNFEKCSTKSGDFIHLTMTNVSVKTWTMTCSSAAVPRTTMNMDDIFLSSLCPKDFVSATTRATFHLD